MGTLNQSHFALQGFQWPLHCHSLFVYTTALCDVYYNLELYSFRYTQKTLCAKSSWITRNCNVSFSCAFFQCIILFLAINKFCCMFDVFCVLHQIHLVHCCSFLAWSSSRDTARNVFVMPRTIIMEEIYSTDLHNRSPKRSSARLF